MLARVKIKDVYQCCDSCDKKMFLGDEIVYLNNNWFCSSDCAIEGNGGYSSCIENCFFDDGEWLEFDSKYFYREYDKNDIDIYKWRNAEIIKKGVK